MDYIRENVEKFDNKRILLVDCAINNSNLIYNAYKMYNTNK